MPVRVPSFVFGMVVCATLAQCKEKPIVMKHPSLPPKVLYTSLIFSQKSFPPKVCSKSLFLNNSQTFLSFISLSLMFIGTCWFSSVTPYKVAPDYFARQNANACHCKPTFLAIDEWYLPNRFSKLRTKK